jgi:hypothetical protein
MTFRTTLARALAVALLAVLAGCPKRSKTGDPTVDWFTDHRKDLDTVRAMLVADQGLVTHIGLGPLGGLHDASGKKGRCGSALRSNDFPWTCDGNVAVNNLDEVEARLGISRGRLRAYERVMPTSVSPGEPCAPVGSFRFWLEDPNSSPCTGLSNIVWSPSPPVVDPDTCRLTVSTHYVPLGDGWYVHACVAPKAK